LGSETGGRADIISHIMASSGNGAQVMAGSATDSPINRRYLAPKAPFAGSIRPPRASGPNRCTQKLRFPPKVVSRSDRISGRIPPGVCRGATAVILPSLSTPPDLSLDLSPGLSQGPVQFQLLPLWPWQGHRPECGGSATPKATILTRIHDSDATI